MKLYNILQVIFCKWQVTYCKCKCKRLGEIFVYFCYICGAKLRFYLGGTASLPQAGYVATSIAKMMSVSNNRIVYSVFSITLITASTAGKVSIIIFIKKWSKCPKFVDFRKNKISETKIKYRILLRSLKNIYSDTHYDI